MALFGEKELIKRMHRKECSLSSWNHMDLLYLTKYIAAIILPIIFFADIILLLNFNHLTSGLDRERACFCGDLLILVQNRRQVCPV